MPQLLCMYKYTLKISNLDKMNITLQYIWLFNRLKVDGVMAENECRVNLIRNIRNLRTPK